SLTAQQTSELTISSNGGADTAPGGTTCNWKYGPNLEYSVAVAYTVPDAKNGLQNLYDQKAAGFFKNGYFEPTTIDGYPGIYGSWGDDRKTGRCELAVGVDETHILNFQLAGSPSK